jgi:hypothetical protein
LQSEIEYLMKDIKRQPTSIKKDSNATLKVLEEKISNK